MTDDTQEEVPEHLRYYQKRVHVHDRRDDLMDALSMVMAVVQQENLDETKLSIEIEPTQFLKQRDEDDDDDERPTMFSPFGPMMQMMTAADLETGYIVSVTGFTKNPTGVSMFVAGTDPTEGDTRHD